MPDHAIVGDFRVGDFSIKERLNPCGVPLLQRLRQWCCRSPKGLQSALNAPSGLPVPSRAHAPDVDQFATFATCNLKTLRARNQPPRSRFHDLILSHCSPRPERYGASARFDTPRLSPQRYFRGPPNDYASANWTPSSINLDPRFAIPSASARRRLNQTRGVPSFAGVQWRSSSPQTPHATDTFTLHRRPIPYRSWD